MKWVQCGFCQAQWPVADDEVIADWEPCDICGRDKWEEEAPHSHHSAGDAVPDLKGSNDSPSSSND